MGNIGAKHRLDVALVGKYANLQTNKFDESKIVEPDKMWRIMNQVNNYNRVMAEISSMKKGLKKVENKLAPKESAASAGP